MTTPEPSPLSESKLDKWQASCVKLIEREMNFPVCCDRLGPRELLELIAQARAARPSPTCATCWHDADCEIQQAAGNYSNPAFGCTLWEPSPPAQDGGRPSS